MGDKNKVLEKLASKSQEFLSIILGSFDLEPDDELPDLVRIPGNNGSTILTSYNESENCNGIELIFSFKIDIHLVFPASDSDQLCKLHNSEAAPGFQENFVSVCDKEATEGGLPEKVADSFVGLSNHNDESKEGVSSDEGLNHHQTSEMSNQQNISMLPKHTNHQEIILGSQEKRGTDTSVSNSGAAACASAVENTSRNVAKKHTHWIMRNAYLRNNQRATNTSKNQELNQQSIEVSNIHGDNALDSMEPPSTQTEEPKIKQGMAAQHVYGFKKP